MSPCCLDQLSVSHLQHAAFSQTPLPCLTIFSWETLPRKQGLDMKPLGWGESREQTLDEKEKVARHVDFSPQSLISYKMDGFLQTGISLTPDGFTTASGQLRAFFLPVTLWFNEHANVALPQQTPASNKSWKPPACSLTSLLFTSWSYKSFYFSCSWHWKMSGAAKCAAPPAHFPMSGAAPRQSHWKSCKSSVYLKLFKHDFSAS